MRNKKVILKFIPNAFFVAEGTLTGAKLKKMAKKLAKIDFSAHFDFRLIDGLDGFFGSCLMPGTKKMLGQVAEHSTARAARKLKHCTKRVDILD